MRVPVKQLKRETDPLPSDKNPFEKSRTAFTKTSTDFATDRPSETIPQGDILSTEENLRRRREMIEAKAFEPSEFAFERAIGANDSLYSNFTELLALTKRKVGRIVVIEAGKRTGFGTGFMVSKNLLLTNWHVFQTKEMAAESEVHFFYEYDALGHPASPAIFKLDAERFYTSNKELDYCFVAVQPADVTGQTSLQTIGYLFLDKSLGKIGEKGVEKLNIIHHPLGDYKQVSIRENLFIDIDTTRIYYETDTAPGSSGSPVFNDQWQVVGLHHKSVAKMTPDGLQYLDKDGNIIPVIDGKIDTTRIVWVKNEGIRISVIVNHVASEHARNEFIASLAQLPPKETLSFSINNTNLLPANNNQTEMQNNSGNNISISVPVGALNAENTIDISLSSKKIASGASASTMTLTQPAVSDELLLEVAKIDKEKGVDFSKCRGYDANFLGVLAALPKAKPKLAKQLALQKNKESELKYFKYSVLFNAVKRMPALSAVNVEGDAKKRLDDSKRDDDWLRDVRIDVECQLTDKFYKGSNFDKGHMSRFEDANWDTTEEKALRNGIYTCFYTNACPQVPALNRTGLWGKLEKQVLEKGIKKEEGKLARMSVFNGPIFDSSKERIFKGVVIPMQFFKIILWLNEDQQLRATAFKLTQEALVDEIQFDEAMRIDEEALDMDKVVAFKNFQCSIKSLSALTDLDFKHLEPFDTFRTQNGENEIVLNTEEALML